MSRIVVVTGTDTGVGKTVVTAALAVRAAARGSVAAVKPVQTGVGAPGDAPADIDEVRRLAGTGVETVELARLAEPLAPETAARRSGATLPTIAEHAAHVHDVARRYDTVIVEGAGGLLVRLDGDGGTLLDLADELGAEVVIVTRAGLGTLNHTELTVRALRDRGIEPAGLAIGAWPERPDLAERCNLEDLPRVTGVPLLAVLPGGAGELSADAFAAGVPGWCSPEDVLRPGGLGDQFAGRPE